MAIPVHEFKPGGYRGGCIASVYGQTCGGLEHAPFHQVVPLELQAAREIATSVTGLAEAFRELTEVLKQWPSIGNHKYLTL